MGIYIEIVGNLIMSLKIIVSQLIFTFGVKKSFLFETMVTSIILYRCEVWGCSISRESWRNIRYMMYKKKLYNMESKRLPKIASNFSQNLYLGLKHGWHKDAKYWLNHWGINEEIIMGSKDNIKDTITSGFY